MSITISNSSYSGQHAGEYLAAGLLAADTIAKGNITVKSNVAYKEVLNVVSTDANLIKDASCDFSDAGAVSMEEKTLVVEEFQINQKICITPFITDWLAKEAGVSAHKDMPDTFEKFIIQHFAEKIADHVETNIWQGTASTSGQWEGLTSKLAADTDVVDVTGAALTSGNILDQMASVAAAIPSQVLYADDMRIYMSNKDFQKFVRSLGGFASVGAAGIDNQGPLFYDGRDLFFDGLKIARTPGLPENTIVAARTSNLFFGTSLLSDLNEIKLIDTRETLGDQNLRFVARFSAGVQTGIGEEIVYRTNAA